LIYQNIKKYQAVPASHVFLGGATSSHERKKRLVEKRLWFIPLSKGRGTRGEQQKWWLGFELETELETHIFHMDPRPQYYQELITS
jgi:hypothetical protein